MDFLLWNMKRDISKNVMVALVHAITKDEIQSFQDDLRSVFQVVWSLNFVLHWIIRCSSCKFMRESVSQNQSQRFSHNSKQFSQKSYGLPHFYWVLLKLWASTCNCIEKSNSCTLQKKSHIGMEWCRWWQFSLFFVWMFLIFKGTAKSYRKWMCDYSATVTNGQVFQHDPQSRSWADKWC